MKILNLYAGIGGNRKGWSEGHEVTAVELDPTIAKIYKDYFPNDTVIVGDAHEYLLKNYKDFDFIWSSPPCPTHSSFRFNIGVRYKGVKPAYPDMKLYQEIILLRTHFPGDWVVENVKPYYNYLIPPTFILQRHPFWSNHAIPEKEFETDKIRSSQIPDLQKLHGFDLSKYKGIEKRKTLRNCVYHPISTYILNYIQNERIKNRSNKRPATRSL
jgi:DNA (cytosine-5)-methyltransferase 1